MSFKQPQKPASIGAAPLLYINLDVFIELLDVLLSVFVVTNNFAVYTVVFRLYSSIIIVNIAVSAGGWYVS